MRLYGFPALLRAQLTETMRSRASLFWTLAFPLFFLFLFGSVMARGNARVATFMMPGLFTSMMVGSTLFAVAMRLVSERESGILRRLRTTPVTATAVVLAHGAAALFTQLVTFGLLFLVAKVTFGVGNSGSPTLLVVVYVAGALALLPIGLLVGSVARDSRSAPPIANTLFFAMLFLSGASLPFAFLPEVIQRAARLLPATWLVEGLSLVMVRGEGIRAVAPTLAILLLISGVGLLLNARLFRWEGTQLLPRGSLALAAGGFALLLGGVALSAPALKMTRTPGGHSPEPGPAKGQLRVLRGATVIDGLGGRIENARVVIHDGRISEVSTEGGHPLPVGAQIDDLRGRFLIPGLFDSHIHLGGSGGFGVSPGEHSPARQVHDLQALLAVGVTGIVSLTDDLDDLASLREDVARGRMRAPRAFLTGPAITAPGGHPTELFSFAPGLVERLTRQVETGEEARKAVEELALRNVDLIKLVLESGAPGHPMPRLQEPVFRAAVAAAKKAGLRVSVHVGTDADARLVVDAGGDGVEHVPTDLSDETIGLMVAKRVSLTPTLTIYDFEYKRAVAEGRDPLCASWADGDTLASLHAPGSFFQRMLGDTGRIAAIGQRFEATLAATRRAARSGVTILAGSDSGNPASFHGPALHHELALLVRAGLTPSDAIRAATSLAATRLGAAELGRIAPQAVADLVVLESDPTADIRAIDTVVGVYLGGLPLNRAKLLESPPGSWLPGRRN